MQLGLTALMCATALKCTKAVRTECMLLLISAGADTEATDKVRGIDLYLKTSVAGAQQSRKA
jgi:hypothetical protein